MLVKDAVLIIFRLTEEVDNCQFRCVFASVPTSVPACVNERQRYLGLEGEENKIEVKGVKETVPEAPEEVTGTQSVFNKVHEESIELKYESLREPDARHGVDDTVACISARLFCGSSITVE